jgi:tRNA-splicing ligase RtcB
MSITVLGDHDEKTLAQLKVCHEMYSEKTVLCADGHLGYGQPIGCVTSYPEHISISGVGFDIGCGNMAVKTDCKLADLSPSLSKVADDIAKNISFGMGRNNPEPVQHALLEKDSHEAWNIPFINELKRNAANQLGTVGGGNHYVDIFADENEDVWVGVHFGSRGLGHTIAKHHMDLLGGKDSMDAPPLVVRTDTDLGRQYLMGMDLAGKYSYAGREYVVDYVVRRILGANVLDSIHNHHNFAWRETHGGKEMWVVRKGATPNFPGQRGFVGGSMGDISVILEGLDNDANKDLLHSTVHGAGRVMSRTKAAGRRRWTRDAEGKRIQVQISKGEICEDTMRVNVKNFGVELRGGGADEAPQAYRPLQSVLDAHKDTIKIHHVLKPLVVVMAGSDLYDPFKD